LQLGQLMNAAIQGIKDATNATGAKMPQIIVHIDRGGDWTTTKWFFENLNYQGVPYDIIGESYYPWWHGSPASLSLCLSNAAVEFGKPIMVAETAFPFTNNFPTSWTNFGSLYGFSATRDGQISFIATVAQVVESIPNHLGAGVFYWGAEYQAASGVNEAGFNTTSFFDAGGNVLPVADAIGGMAAPLLVRPSLNGSQMRLQWPFCGAASKLTTSTILTLLTQWPSVPDPVQTTGAVFTVTLPVDSSQSRFYRLQSN
jgi:arabinogalactan endo-1,4-beta-galactosidase